MPSKQRKNVQVLLRCFSASQPRQPKFLGLVNEKKSSQKFPNWSWFILLRWWLSDKSFREATFALIKTPWSRCDCCANDRGYLAAAQAVSDLGLPGAKLYGDLALGSYASELGRVNVHAVAIILWRSGTQLSLRVIQATHAGVTTCQRAKAKNDIPNGRMGNAFMLMKTGDRRDGKTFHLWCAMSTILFCFSSCYCKPLQSPPSQGEKLSWSFNAPSHY